ncbi:MAG: glycosyltransferase [Gammaproteobacteria bacterium]|nr:glycosyltransferase [Gammaproteobacteria bacterium]MBM2829568.1 glycosyltransferase [Gammaproteobacteria bacterium]
MVNGQFSERRETNILVLTSTFPRWQDDTEPGFVYQLCQRLSDSHNIKVLAPHCMGAKRKELMGNVEIIRFRYFLEKYQTLAYAGGILAKIKEDRLRMLLVPLFILSQLIHLLVLLRKERFDAIHAHWLIPQGFVAILAMLLARKSIPVICISHGGDLYALQGSIIRLCKLWVLSRCAAVCVVSHSMADYLRQLGIPEDKIHVAPMGVDLTTVFVPDENAIRNKNTIMFIGRLVEKKGVKYLLQAFRENLKNNRSLKLVIIGDGPEKTPLMELAKLLEIDDHTTFVGAVSSENLPYHYRTASIMVFPFIKTEAGDQEGLGLVLIEALGCHCAVIASDMPAVKDVIIDGGTGFLAKPGNVSELTAKIEYLLSHPDLAERIGCKGREFVMTRFDWNIVSERYKTITNKIINQVTSYNC